MGIALVTAWLFVSPSSPGRADTITLHLKVKGDTAVASFDTTDPEDPCIQSFVSVVASDVIEKQLPDGKTVRFRTPLIVSQRDVCLGINLLSAEGETPRQSFQCANDLRSATLRTTVPVFDSLTLQFYDFDVDLTWIAQGAPVFHHCKETFRDKELGLRINSHLRGRHAAAEAIGTIVGLDRNLTPGPSVSDELQTENAGTIIIEKTM
jgi:hypothetical protein